jgi:UDP-N-acetylmuramate dehydrogenase
MHPAAADDRPVRVLTQRLTPPPPSPAAYTPAARFRGSVLDAAPPRPAPRNAAVRHPASLAGVRIEHDVPLAPLTTLRLGGPARRLVAASTQDELVEAVSGAEPPVLVLAGGSNLVLPDDGWDGTVVRVATRGVEVEGSRLVAQAGEDWDALVARCVGAGLAGVECLSGIPGSTGATPIQNVGAYGQEVSGVITRVRALDRAASEVVELEPPECRFGYRTSAFKRDPGRHVVLEVEFALQPDELGEPLRYAELARALDVPIGGRAALVDVRATVLALRRGKGMVLDPCDVDTVSAGSFFTNPILTDEQFVALRERADITPPAFPDAAGHVKTSAAWLVEHAGFRRGYGNGRARLSSKHTLALTNRGGSTAELLALAREIRDGVREAFGVTLEPEPTIVGEAL